MPLVPIFVHLREEVAAVLVVVLLAPVRQDDVVEALQQRRLAGRLGGLAIITTDDAWLARPSGAHM